MILIVHYIHYFICFTFRNERRIRPYYSFLVFRIKTKFLIAFEINIIQQQLNSVTPNVEEQCLLWSNSTVTLNDRNAHYNGEMMPMFKENCD